MLEVWLNVTVTKLMGDGDTLKRYGWLGCESKNIARIALRNKSTFPLEILGTILKDCAKNR